MIRVCSICKKDFNARAVSQKTCSKLCRTIHIENRKKNWVENTKKEKIAEDTSQTKVCSKCDTEKNVTEFSFSSSIKNGKRASWCRECRSKQKKDFNSTPEGKRRNFSRALKSKYGITAEEYDEMYNDQKGCCAICEKHQSSFTRRLSVDHDHSNGVVRKLLCTNCNLILGNANDNIEILKKAIKYLTITRR